MEDIQINELCTSCICKRNNCKNIESHKEGTCMIYKCLNYCLDINTIHPYEAFPYSIRSNNEKIKHKKLYS